MTLFFYKPYCFIKVSLCTFICPPLYPPIPTVLKTRLLAISSLDRALLLNRAASLPGNLENIFCSLSSLSAGAEKFIFYQPQGSECYSENPAFNQACAQLLLSVTCQQKWCAHLWLFIYKLNNPDEGNQEDEGKDNGRLI